MYTRTVTGTLSSTQRRRQDRTPTGLVAHLVPDSPRCTQATLEALGIYGECPTTGGGVLEAIQRAGFTYDDPGGDWSTGRISIAQAIERFPKGRYYLSGKGHAMALVDGVLVDTAGEGYRRKVYVYEILPLES